jgi:hypothetical protein
VLFGDDVRTTSRGSGIVAAAFSGELAQARWTGGQTVARPDQLVLDDGTNGRGATAKSD